jgi:mono/diheme cytochrome c family protein
VAAAPAAANANGGGNGNGNNGNGNGNGGPGGGASQAVDPGVRGGPAGAGGPFPGLTQDQLNFFNAAQNVFEEVDDVPHGLGPGFNANSCAACHAAPSVGGSSPPTNPQVAIATLDGAQNTVPSFITANGPIREARFVNNPDGSPDGDVHNLFTITGRSDAPGCTLAQPDFAGAVAANNIIFRIPTPTFGLGLVEAMSDEALRADFSAAAQQRSSLGIAGGFNTSGNTGNITRFGWKAQNPSVLVFTQEAYNVEQGVSNEGFPEERNNPPSNCLFNPTPEDTTPLTAANPSGSQASDFNSDDNNFASFIKFLAPPTPATPGSPTTTPAATASSTTSPAATASSTTTPATTTPATTQVASADATSALAAAAGTASTSSTGSTGSAGSTVAGDASQGQQVFQNVGCSACHTPSMTTGNSTIAAESNVTFNPFSDFAIHDMGSGLADRVSQGAANGQQFRTAPLWGAGQRLFFLHDGRANDLVTAIEAHASQGSEANTVIQNFNMLSQADQQALVDFLRSL